MNLMDKQSQKYSVIDISVVCVVFSSSSLFLTWQQLWRSECTFIWPCKFFGIFGFCGINIEFDSFQCQTDTSINEFILRVNL